MSGPRPVHRAPPLAANLRQQFAAASFGFWLAVVPVKFGNPVIFSHLLPVPQDIGEIFFNTWPVAWSYIALGLLVVAALPVIRWRKPRPYWLLTLPLAWVAWNFLSATQTVDLALTRLTLLHFVGCAMCLSAGYFALGEVRDWHPLALGLALGLTFILASALDQHFGGLERARAAFESLPIADRVRLDTPEFRKKILSTRVFGTFIYPNALAGGILLLLPLALIALNAHARHPFLRRGLCAFLALAGLASLYWSGSKSGWLIALVMGGLALWRWPAKFSFKATLFVVLVTLGVAAFLGRHGAYFEKGASSLSARLDYWRAALTMVQQRPLLGYGPGTFQRQYAALKPPDAEMAKLAHNDYLQQACDAGIPAFLAYATFVALSVILLYRRSRAAPLQFAAWLGVFGFAVQGLTEFGLYIPALAWPFFLLLGWLWSQPSNQIDKKTASP